MAENITVTIDPSVIDADGFTIKAGPYGDVTHNLGTPPYTRAQMISGVNVSLPGEYSRLNVTSDTQGTCGGISVDSLLLGVKLNNASTCAGSFIDVVVKNGGTTVADLNYALPLNNSDTTTYAHLPSSFKGLTRTFYAQAKNTTSEIKSFQTKLLDWGGNETVVTSANINPGENGGLLNASVTMPAGDSAMYDFCSIWNEDYIYPITLNQSVIYINDTNYACPGSSLTLNIQALGNWTLTIEDAEWYDGGTYTHCTSDQYTGGVGSTNVNLTMGSNPNHNIAGTVRVELDSDPTKYMNCGFIKNETCP